MFDYLYKPLDIHDQRLKIYDTFYDSKLFKTCFYRKNRLKIRS